MGSAKEPHRFKSLKMQEVNKNSNKPSWTDWLNFAAATLCTLPFVALICIREFDRFPKIHSLWEIIIVSLAFGWPILATIGIVGIFSSLHTIRKIRRLSVFSIFYIVIIVGYSFWLFYALESIGP
jgi:hypothetical protein